MENDLEDLFTYGIKIIDDIKNRQQGLDYLRQIIEKINNSNKEKDIEIQGLKNNESKLNKKINELDNESQELYEKNQELHEKNQQLCIENENFKKYEALYYKQENIIKDIKSQLEKKEKELENKDKIISNLDNDLKNKQKEIEEKDNKINSLQAQLLGLQSDKEQGKVINDYLQKINIVEGSIKDLLKEIRDIKLDRKNENLPEVYVNNVENKDYNPNENFGEQEEDKDCQAQSEGDSPSSYDGANKIVTG